MRRKVGEKEIKKKIILKKKKKKKQHKKGTNQGYENRPMDTDDYFNLMKQIEEESRRNEEKSWGKGDKKENNTGKEEKKINQENNYPQQPPKNPHQDAQYNQGFEPAPPSNQKPWN